MGTESRAPPSRRFHRRQGGPERHRIPTQPLSVCKSVLKVLPQELRHRAQNPHLRALREPMPLPGQNQLLVRHAEALKLPRQAVCVRDRHHRISLAMHDQRGRKRAGRVLPIRPDQPAGDLDHCANIPHGCRVGQRQKRPQGDAQQRNPPRIDHRPPAYIVQRIGDRLQPLRNMNPILDRLRVGSLRLGAVEVVRSVECNPQTRYERCNAFQPEVGVPARPMQQHNGWMRTSRYRLRLVNPNGRAVARKGRWHGSWMRAGCAGRRPGMIAG
jgi:hypothetical protein